jgi:hypothetical protein
MLLGGRGLAQTGSAGEATIRTIRNERPEHGSAPAGARLLPLQGQSDPSGGACLTQPDRCPITILAAHRGQRWRRRSVVFRR